MPRSKAELYQMFLERGYEPDEARVLAGGYDPRPEACQDTTMTIRWEEPPATALFAGQKVGQYGEFAQALRANKGKWAVLPGTRATPDSAKGTAQNIRRGVMKSFAPKGEFETAVDGTVIYVRYVGADGIDPDAAPGGSDPEDDDDNVIGEREPDTRAVRAWARANGFENLPERGRMPADVHLAYRRAHGLTPEDEPEDAPEGAQEDTPES